MIVILPLVAFVICFCIGYKLSKAKSYRSHYQMPDTSSNRPRVSMKVSREGQKTYFTFEVPKAISAIFEAKSDEIRESESWPGHQFYFCPEVTKDRGYKELLEQYHLFDDYGHTMVREDGRFNVAFLRTVGGAGKIEVKKDLSFAHVSDQVRQIVKFLKAYYENFLGDWQVSGSTEFEI